MAEKYMDHVGLVVIAHMYSVYKVHHKLIDMTTPMCYSKHMTRTLLNQGIEIFNYKPLIL